jgi:hypothetical protein
MYWPFVMSLAIVWRIVLYSLLFGSAASDTLSEEKRPRACMYSLMIGTFAWPFHAMQC